MNNIKHEISIIVDTVLIAFSAITVQSIIKLKSMGLLNSEEEWFEFVYIGIGVFFSLVILTIIAYSFLYLITFLIETIWIKIVK